VLTESGKPWRSTIAMIFMTFSTLGRSDLGASALRHHEGCVNEAFFFVEHAAFAQFVGDVHENAAQNFTAAPGLKAAMNRFVVRIALREHVPLRAGVEYPKRPFKNLACRDRPAARPPVRNVLFGKVRRIRSHCKSLSRIIPHL